MLVRQRRSRIFYLRKFFECPIRLSFDTIRKLGIWKTVRIGLSYFRSVLRPIRLEHTLEQFFINRFGRELYRTFFKSLHREGLGRALRKNQRGMGSAAHQGPRYTKP